MNVFSTTVLVMAVLVMMLAYALYTLCTPKGKRCLLTRLLAPFWQAMHQAMFCWRFLVCHMPRFLVHKEVFVLHATIHPQWRALWSSWTSGLTASVALGLWWATAPMTIVATPDTSCSQTQATASPFVELQFVDIQDKTWTIASWQKAHQKPVLLVFWAPWCGPCLAEMPSLARFARKHKAWLDVLPISVDDRLAAPTSLTPVIDEQEDVRSDLALFQKTSDNPRWRDMKINRIPSFVALSGDGVVMAQFSGQKNWDNPKMIPEIQAFLTTIKKPAAHLRKTKGTQSSDDKGDNSHATKANAKKPSASKGKAGKEAKNVPHTKGRKRKHRSRSRHRSSESVSQASSVESVASHASGRRASARRSSTKHSSVKHPSGRRSSSKHSWASQKQTIHPSGSHHPKRRRPHTVTKRVGQSTGGQAMWGGQAIGQAMAPRIKHPVVAAMCPQSFSPHTIIYAPSDRL